MLAQPRVLARRERRLARPRFGAARELARRRALGVELGADAAGGGERRRRLGLHGGDALAQRALGRDDALLAARVRRVLGELRLRLRLRQPVLQVRQPVRAEDPPRLERLEVAHHVADLLVERRVDHAEHRRYFGGRRPERRRLLAARRAARGAEPLERDLRAGDERRVGRVAIQ